MVSGSEGEYTFLREQALLNIALDTTQQERPQNLMELLHDHVLVAALRLEPLIERAGVTEHIRQQEIEQGPQFVEVVLQWGSGDEETITGVEDTDNLSKGGLLVLDAVGFVNDDVFPGEFLKMGLFAQDHLVGGDHNVEVLGEDTLINEFGALFFGALEDENVDAGGPVLEFALPVVEGGFGDGDEVRTRDTGNVAEVSEELRAISFVDKGLL